MVASKPFGRKLADQLGLLHSENIDVLTVMQWHIDRFETHVCVCVCMYEYMYV